MKIKILLLAILMAFLASPEMFAQKKKDKGKKKEEKKEAKEWEQKLESTSIEEFKNVIEGQQELTGKKRSLETESKRQTLLLNELDQALAVKTQTLNDILAQIEAIKAEQKAQAEQPIEEPTKNQKNWDKGQVFKVQVGSFRNPELAKLQDGDFWIKENDPSKQDKERKVYTIAHFLALDEAQQLKDYLVKIGMKDAKVITYQDGKRISASNFE